MYQLVSFGDPSGGPFSCPAQSSQFPATPFTVTSGTIVSVGFQNIGFAQLLRASQMFVLSPTTAFVQVVNTSFSSTEWVAWVVVDTGASFEVELKTSTPEMHTEPIREPETYAEPRKQ